MARRPWRGIIERMNRAITTSILALALAAQATPSIASPVSPLPVESRDEALRSVEPPDAAPAAESTRLQNLLMHAISQIGVKYQFGGSSAHTGFDCSGFVRHVFAESLALELPRSSYAMGKLGVSIAKDDLQAGDLVFYNTLHRPFSHVGIYLGEGRFVHAPSRGKRVEIVDM